MKGESERIRRLSNEAEGLKQQLASVEKEYVDLYMREKALERMVSQSTARYTALSANLADPQTSSRPGACSSKEVFEAHAPSSSMMQFPQTDASAGAQDLTVCGLVTEHIAYIGRASVLVVRMGTYAARPGDRAELEELTRCHWGNIVKTALTRIQTLWLCYGLNFETGEVEEAPDELFPDVLSKLGLTQEQMLTLSAGMRASLCCMWHVEWVLLRADIWCNNGLLLSNCIAWGKGLDVETCHTCPALKLCLEICPCRACHEVLHQVL